MANLHCHFPAARDSSHRGRRHGQPRRLAVESLENRLLLTVPHPALELAPAVESSEPDFVQQSTDQQTQTSSPTPPGLCTQLELQIEGTNVTVDFMGLPSSIEGNVYYASGEHAGTRAGTYQESIDPILHPDFGFIGATGTGTFTFEAGAGAMTPGQLTVSYLAMIEGQDMETGALLVNSSGTVVAGTGSLANMKGAFASSSAVLLGEQFSMEVTVSLEACRSLPPAGHGALALGSASANPASPAAAPPHFSLNTAGHDVPPMAASGSDDLSGPAKDSGNSDHGESRPRGPGDSSDPRSLAKGPPKPMLNGEDVDQLLATF